MKNQYFGDIHDFYKYVMLKWFMKNSEEKLLIAWYLTKDDEIKKDGNKREYLKKFSEFEKNNILDICNEIKDLFEFLKENHNKKNIGLIEEHRHLIAKKMDFFNKNLDCKNRSDWFESLKKKAKETDIIFLDPDNGIKFNNKKSNKHVMLSEIKELWKMDKSLIVYQHFLMVDYEVLMAGIIWKLFKVLKPIDRPYISIVYTKNVANIFILKEKHKKLFEDLKNKINSCNKNTGKDFLKVFVFNSEKVKC